MDTVTLEQALLRLLNFSVSVTTFPTVGIHSSVIRWMDIGAIRGHKTACINNGHNIKKQRPHSLLSARIVMKY
jgi:hypothetical protein